MKCLPSTFTHGWCSFSQRCHLGGGEIRTTLSPRTIINPSFFTFSILVVSSVSSKTRFRCWSNHFNLPRRLFPPFNLTSTAFPRFCSRISVVISLILHPRSIHLCFLYLNLYHLNLSKREAPCLENIEDTF